MPLDRPPHLPSSSLPPRVLRVLAPAKVNLHLRVGPPRADGFHPLLTWMCTASLFDTLTIEARPIETFGARGEASPSGLGRHERTAPPKDERSVSAVAP